MTNPFATPASASGINWENLAGRLLVIEPHSVETGIQTSFGAKDAVRADVHVLDGTEAGTTYGDSLIFPGVLISQLRPNLGQKVPGRLGQGNAKPGQRPPWKLDDPSEEDMQRCMAWLNGQQQNQFTTGSGQEQVNTSTGEVTSAQGQANVAQGLGAQPVQQQAAQPAVDQETTTKIQTLIGAGFKDDEIASATGAGAATITAIRNAN